MQRTAFELNVTEDAPTKDQMRTILEYVGGKKASQLISGARDEADALKKLGEDGEKFQRPVVSRSLEAHLLSMLDFHSVDANDALDRGLEQWQSW